MKRIIISVVSILFACTLSAQSVDSLYIDARGSFLQKTVDGAYSSALKAEYLNVQMWGSLTDNLTFRLRQRLNVGIDKDNPFSATDWMCLTWQATPRVKLYAGKTAILIGGYEYDSAPIDVYYYSQFCTNLNQCFAFSVNGEYEFLPGQSLALQIANSPLYYGFGESYSYNFAWVGGFAPWWKTIWSFNMVEDEYDRMISYIALGNHCRFGNLFVDVDLFHRASFEQSHYFFSDYSIVGKLIWSVGRWNLCTKVGYETNSPGNVDSHGRAYDTIIPPGTEYVYGGAGIEYFPLGNENVRLHLAYYRDNFDHSNNLTLGLKWRFDIISSK